MEEIDITSSGFSLDVPYNIGETVNDDYTIYMYIGIFIFILAIGWLVYNYTLQRKRVTFQDKLDECYSGDKCYGGVCERDGSL